MSSLLGFFSQLDITANAIEGGGGGVPWEAIVAAITFIGGGLIWFLKELESRVDTLEKTVAVYDERFKRFEEGTKRLDLEIQSLKDADTKINETYYRRYSRNNRAISKMTAALNQHGIMVGDEHVAVNQRRNQQPWPLKDDPPTIGYSKQMLKDGDIDDDTFHGE